MTIHRLFLIIQKTRAKFDQSCPSSSILIANLSPAKPGPAANLRVIMPWEQRGPDRYYYRKRRLGDRVISEYVGAGLVGRLAAAQDAAQRRQQRAERRRQAALDAELNTVYRLIQSLTHATLLVNGYHTHKGQWRKKRNGKKK